ncbi:MAG: hypothetical protein WC692_09405 [Erythrobacter sp.]|jgi:hypothetical protein
MAAKDRKVKPQKLQWDTPELVRLGTIRDVAGSGGLGRQSPIQLRS